MLKKLTVIFTLFLASLAHAAEGDTLKPLLSRAILTPTSAMEQAQAYCEPRIPSMPSVTSLAQWEALATKMRSDVLNNVVFRGQAAAWRDAKTKVQWLDTLDAGPGYKIKKLRYEALPGLWIPALLYEPEKLTAKTPVVLNVNGHDGAGKAADYKQLRCINLAKRGILALNPEWFGMGQLSAPGYGHGRMNQIDLCGAGGIAVHYLAMSRGLDLLLSLPSADPNRVAVTGLSGGGWQTIFISSLDTRITLTNPVAGYSSFKTRARHLMDLGDSEQTPCDLATVADYNHLTAMMAPRATLLTFNSKDACCFTSGHALEPLMDAAKPIFALHNKPQMLRSHVNDDPGTHNYENDNRQAFYRMVGDAFYHGDSTFPREEIPSESEVKTKEQLNVEIPAGNATFNSLAMDLARNLPNNPELPTDKSVAMQWQSNRREKLRHIVKFKEFSAAPERIAEEEKDGTKVVYWKLKFGSDWTIAAIELTRGAPTGTTILMIDGGRASQPAEVENLLNANQRVIAIDPFYFGESKVIQKDYLFALLIATIGDRALGIQAGQVAATAKWASQTHKLPVHVKAVGPRTSLIALAAAAVEELSITSLSLSGSFASLKEIIEQNKSYEQMPEAFTFGLLESFDILQLSALVAPRKLDFPSPSDRLRRDLAALGSLYVSFGSTHRPFN